MPSMTKEVPFGSELHKKLAKMLMSRIRFAQKGQEQRHSEWSRAEDNVLAFVPESDLDARRRTERENKGEPKYTTIMIPYTYAMLMTMHTYLTSVFFARTPVHQFSGRHGESEEQTQALEALIAYQNQVGKMMGPYYIWLYDIGKYGVGVIEEYWEKEQAQFSAIQEVPAPSGAVEFDGTPKMVKAQVRVNMPGYEGHRLCNISPFDFFPDPRVPVGRFQEGEFCIVRKRLSWEQIVRRKKQGYYVNVDEVGKKGQGGDKAQTFGSSQLERPEDNLVLFEGDDLEHPAIVPVYECYVTIIPEEWGLGDSDFPEKWVFTITSDMHVVIGAQPHGAMHCEYPFLVGEHEVEGYGTWNRGLPEIIQPVQQTMDWLINQHFFNVRAALNNQFILDPSRIMTRDAEDGGPGFVYRLRPRAYGQDVRTMFYQVPVQDMTRGHIGDMQTMLGIGERITGINDQIMGVLNAGGRKTATEVRTTTGFGVNRLKTITEFLSATAFSQHAQRLVQGSQQYYSGEKKLRLVGSLAQDMGPEAMQKFVNVTPESIKGFYDFVPVDGTLPVDRLAMANLWKDILLQMRQVPGLMQQYDLGRIFAYVASLAGVRNIGQFKIQVGSPQAMLQQADAGNLVPVKPNGSRLPAGVPNQSPAGPAQAVPPPPAATPAPY